jgi:hypothetical protein
MHGVSVFSSFGFGFYRGTPSFPLRLFDHSQK